MVDPIAWSRAAPKFQAHHATLLAGDSDIVITRPLLMIHGDADLVTPVEHVLALRSSAPGHLETLIIPGAGHTFRVPSDIRKILAAETRHLSGRSRDSAPGSSA